MSRGSTFTLYRAYNNFKADSDKLSSVKEEYYKYNKKNNYFGDYDFFTGKKHSKKEIEENDRMLKEDIPEIMDGNFKSDESRHESDNYNTINEFRSSRYEDYINRDDGTYMDKLLEWDFTSGFNCLINEYGLNYGFRKNSVIIDESTAKEMLSAIEYLLGGKYDDSVEQSMNNRFIKIFSEGNDCDSYWKYVNRKIFDKKCEKYEFENQKGIKVKITIPSRNDVEEDDEDDVYGTEFSESDSEQEYYMRKTATALRAFLESDEWSYRNDTKLVLVYSCWG